MLLMLPPLVLVLVRNVVLCLGKSPSGCVVNKVKGCVRW